MLKELTNRELLEQDWAEWCRRFLRGKVDGEFPEAEDLLDERSNHE